MSARSRIPVCILALALLLLAGGLRCWRLGDWPFANDELSTFAEADSLFGVHATEDLSDQVDRLPRVLPVAYVLHRLDYAIFGRDESGSRAICALLGTVGVLVTFLLLRGTLGTAGATTVALLVALWPDHVFHSQQNRFYIIAWLFSALTMLLGARALKRRSRTSLALACVAGVLAVLSHTVLAVVVATLPVALALGFLVESRQPGAPARGEVLRLLLLPAVTLALLLALYVFHIRPLMGEWNAGDEWSYSSLHSAGATINSLGWPVVLCAIPGALLALRWRDGQGVYWLCFTALLAVSVLVLPRAVVYHPHYAFAMALGVFVCVGFFVEWIAETAREKGRTLLPTAAVVALALLNVPSLVSYYQDGSRDDYRGVARYLVDHWREGDRVLANWSSLLVHYAPGLNPVYPLRGLPLGEIQRRASGPGRCWILVRTNRAGIPEPQRTWLGEHCRWPMLATVPRYDYSDYRIYVFLHEDGG